MVTLSLSPPGFSLSLSLSLQIGYVHTATQVTTSFSRFRRERIRIQAGGLLYITTLMAQLSGDLRFLVSDDEGDEDFHFCVCCFFGDRRFFEASGC
jgi:hypothetical protein